MRKTLFFIFTLFLVGLVHAQEKNNPKFSGLMFGDYFYNAAAHDSTKKNSNGFQFRRIYVTTDYSISDNFSTRFRFESTEDYLTTNGKITTIVKDAWLKWKDIFSGSDLIFGISPTPAYDVSEGAWGHRYLEKTVMDLEDIVSSRDFGVDLKGKLSQNGTVKYWLKIGNGSGNSPESNKDKTVYGLLEFNPSPELLITAYGEYASQPQTASKKDDNIIIGAGFVNFKQKGKFSIGVEGFIKSQQNSYTPPNGSLGSKSAFGLSIWVYANLSDKAQIIGRFDTYDPNTNSNSNKDGKNFILAGLQFNPVEYVSITPNVEIFTYQADSPNHGDSSDIIPRVTFNWEF
jgi:hypothetical protein